MVTLPLPFVSTQYPGYFWNLDDKKLYSLKVDGVLTPMKITYPHRFNRLQCSGYYVSVKGIRKHLSTSTLNKLTDEDSVIPMKEK